MLTRPMTRILSGMGRVRGSRILQDGRSRPGRGKGTPNRRLYVTPKVRPLTDDQRLERIDQLELQLERLRAGLPPTNQELEEGTDVK